MAHDGYDNTFFSEIHLDPIIFSADWYCFTWTHHFLNAFSCVYYESWIMSHDKNARLNPVDQNKAFKCNFYL